MLVGVPNKPVVIPVMLTKKERKKIRKQRRRELELEKQEKIRFGFIDKPEPKGNKSTKVCILYNVVMDDFKWTDVDQSMCPQKAPVFKTDF